MDCTLLGPRGPQINDSQNDIGYISEEKMSILLKLKLISRRTFHWKVPPTRPSPTCSADVSPPSDHHFPHTSLLFDRVHMSIVQKYSINHWRNLLYCDGREGRFLQVSQKKCLNGFAKNQKTSNESHELNLRNESMNHHNNESNYQWMNGTIPPVIPLNCKWFTPQ